MCSLILDGSQPATNRPALSRSVAPGPGLGRGERGITPRSLKPHGDPGRTGQWVRTQTLPALHDQSWEARGLWDSRLGENQEGCLEQRLVV